MTIRRVNDLINLVAALSLCKFAAICISLVWYVRHRHSGHCFLPEYLSKANRQDYLLLNICINERGLLCERYVCMTRSLVLSFQIHRDILDMDGWSHHVYCLSPLPSTIDLELIVGVELLRVLTFELLNDKTLI